MPGLVKIGKTRLTVEMRAEQLSRASGVPRPYEIIFSQFVYNCDGLERLIHSELAKCRDTKNREFFIYAPDDAIAWVRSIILASQHQEEQFLAACNPLVRKMYMARKESGRPPLPISQAQRDAVIQKAMRLVHRLQKENARGRKV